MLGIRELLAVVLGAGLGVALVAKPREMLKLSVFVGPNRRRRHDGRYGEDDHPFGDWVPWLVRAAGVACIAVAAFIAYQNV